MKTKLIFILIFITTFNNCLAQLNVDSSVVTPNTLLTAITAGGIAVSNISYTGDSLAASTFLCSGTCNLGITGGIILTSGHATIASSPNSTSGQGFNVNLPGDSDLDLLTTGGTLDACVLEFDFIALSDTAIFNYIFASEEYSEYVNTSFNDVFGFFISGPGIVGIQNIANVPGTSIPIAINNVNNGNSMGIPIGPCNNCSYFHDNVIDTFTTAYDGLTTVLTATAANIIPGQTYHLKLAVADVSDHVFDTGVFLQEGSFRIASPPAMFIGGHRNTADTVHICQGGTVALSAPSGFSYLWSTGESTQSINVSTAGSYNVTITGFNNNFPVNSPLINFIVDNNSIPNPVLSFANNFVSSSITASGYTYSWTINGVSAIGSDSSAIPALQDGCYAITVQDASGCFLTSDTLCIIPTGISHVLQNNSSQVFPNPFHSSTTLLFENTLKESYTFHLYDITGFECRKIENIKSGRLHMEKGNLNAGVYFYEFVSPGSRTVIKGKFICN